MINEHFGIKDIPFHSREKKLLAQQQKAYDVIISHCRVGGFCIVYGQPGTGKTALKEALRFHDEKRLFVPIISRTLHTYHSVLRILCEAFQVDYSGGDYKCERQLIEEAYKLHQQNKMLCPIIDDAQYLPIECLRKIRLLFEDFPRNHNLVMIAHPSFDAKLKLSVNEDIYSRVTWSTEILPMAPEEMEAFILKELDKATMPHSIFDQQALNLIIKASEGILRAARNLCVGSLMEAVRDQTRTVTLKQVNAVLMQPHWRRDYDTRLPTKEGNAGNSQI